MNLGDRLPQNPLITARDVKPSLPTLEVVSVFNAASARVGKEIILLLRVAELAGALPEVVEPYINPLVLTDKGCVVVDARVRVAPARHTDPFLRTLRTT